MEEAKRQSIIPHRELFGIISNIYREIYGCISFWLLRSVTLSMVNIIRLKGGTDEEYS